MRSLSAATDQLIRYYMRENIVLYVFSYRPGHKDAADDGPVIAGYGE